MNKTIFNELARCIAGDVLTDEISRCLYATDASIYEELPMAVVRPKDKLDCVQIINFANRHNIGLIPRAAGTSIAGQCVGNGMVVDISRYMTERVSVVENDSIRVQPGVILDDLNDQLKLQGLRFAPDISTSNRCMIGGMIGNNAAGSHSVVYGTTREHIMELEVILADGSLLTFGPVNEAELNEKQGLQTREGDIYRTLFQMIDRHHDHILSAFPKANIIRRNTGYPLDYLANSKPWNVNGPDFNLAPFMCGTEGTLAFITEAKLRLLPVVPDRKLVCVHFSDLMQAMQSVELMLEHQPAAIELIDKRILDLAKENIEQKQNRFWIEGDPLAVLITEFHGDSNTVEKKTEAFTAWLEENKIGYSYSVIKKLDVNRVWSIRKAGLGLLMGSKTNKKPIAVIEDAAVSPADLPAYVADILALMKRYETDCVYYGHASVGLLHVRPELDLKNDVDREKFVRIAGEVADLVLKYKGALSGEHGDGRVRAPFLNKQLGDNVYHLFETIKKTFDPNGIFNPGKIISTKSLDSNLRGAGDKQTSIIPLLDWQSDLGLTNAIAKCNGVGVCRKSAGRGIMCPSYKASHEEKFSTRGRSSVLRYIVNSTDTEKLLATPEVKEILDTCLGCKGCKSECPSNVDMARLKSEFLHLYNTQVGKSLEVRLAQYHGPLYRLATRVPRISNMLLGSRLTGLVLGFAKGVRLPLFANAPLSRSLLSQPVNADKPVVVLLLDIYTRYYEPEIAQASVYVLNELGYEIVPIYYPDSPRMFISYGLLTEAKRSLARLIEQLEPYNDIPIVGLEPSELLTLRDEAIDLVDSSLRDKVKAIKNRSYLFEEFIEKNKLDKKIRKLAPQNKKFLIHVHCHQKSLTGTKSALKVIADMPGAEAEVIDSGCCGMAGSFGYKFYDMSTTIAKTSLVPAINAEKGKATVVAAGFSCRQQVLRETGVKAYHPANVIADALAL